MTWANWLAELELTLKSPQSGARRIMAMELPLGTAWMALKPWLGEAVPWSSLPWHPTTRPAKSPSSPTAPRR